jgi:hypothetical protein
VELWRSEQIPKKVVIETKLRRVDQEKVINEGLTQTAAYMDRTDTSDGHLTIFDMSDDRTWEEKVFQQQREFSGTPITVWGM